LVERQREVSGKMDGKEIKRGRETTGEKGNASRVLGSEVERRASSRGMQARSFQEGQ